MDGDNTKSSHGTGSWVMLVFLAVVAFHLAGILGIAMFNGWKFNGIGTTQPQKETPPQIQQTLVPEKEIIPETPVIPAAKSEPVRNEAKISSPEQNALEKQILTTSTDTDEDADAIPAPAVSEKPLTGAGGSSAVVGVTVPEKSPRKTASATKPISAPPVVVSNPSKTASAPVSGKGYGTYSVQKGDTLSKIAREFNTTPDNLSKINSLKDPLSLKAGMTIKVPGK